LRIFQVDAFTETRFTGNPATVVLDADGVGDATLSALAAEFSHAEVAYVLAAGAADHDVRLRFMNARREMPFVGHATLAAHAVLLSTGRRGAGVCRQMSGTGIIEVTARTAANAAPFFSFRQAVPQLGPPLPFKTTLRVAEALGLPATRLHQAMPARVAQKGATRLLVPVVDADALQSLRPNLDTLLTLGTELGAEGFFVFAAECGAGPLTTESRMFCPALGIDEDPVSGNAHAMLAAYLWEGGRLDGESSGFVGRQGRHVARPGRVDVRLEIDQGMLRAVHVGGTAAIVSEGTLAR
jgi:PhzF family phenazine biosynthesis protein